MNISFFHCYQSQPLFCNICLILADISRNSHSTCIPKGIVDFPPKKRFSKSEASQFILNLLLSYFLATFEFNLPKLADNYRAGRQANSLSNYAWGFHKSNTLTDHQSIVLTKWFLRERSKTAEHVKLD